MRFHRTAGYVVKGKTGQAQGQTRFVGIYSGLFAQVPVVAVLRGS